MMSENEWNERCIIGVSCGLWMDVNADKIWRGRTRFSMSARNLFVVCAGTDRKPSKRVPIKSKLIVKNTFHWHTVAQLT